MSNSCRHEQAIMSKQPTSQAFDHYHLPLGINSTVNCNSTKNMPFFFYFACCPHLSALRENTQAREERTNFGDCLCGVRKSSRCTKSP